MRTYVLLAWILKHRGKAFSCFILFQWKKPASKCLFIRYYLVWSCDCCCCGSWFILGSSMGVATFCEMWNVCRKLSTILKKKTIKQKCEANETVGVSALSTLSFVNMMMSSCLVSWLHSLSPPYPVGLCQLLVRGVFIGGTWDFRPPPCQCSSSFWKRDVLNMHKCWHRHIITIEMSNWFERMTCMEFMWISV